MPIQKESQKTKQAIATRLEKHKQWAALATLVGEHFSQVALRAIDENYPEYLYFHRDDSERLLQLFSGMHPIDVTYKRDQYGEKTGLQVHTEDGAAMVVSQATTGCLAITLYPYKSQQKSMGSDSIDSYTHYPG